MPRSVSVRRVLASRGQIIGAVLLFVHCSEGGAGEVLRCGGISPLAVASVGGGER
jgi:hypothetical protein